MKRIDWLNHGLEFLVVLIGIFLAFQIDKCAVNNKNERMVQEHLTNIIEETASNQKRLVATIKRAEQNIAMLDSTIQLLRAERDFSTINNNSMALLNIGSFYAFQNAYNTLVQSGDIRLITDFELKNRIINTYEYYNWVKGFDSSNLEVYQQYYYPYIMNNFDIMNYRPVEENLYLDRKFTNAIAAYRYLLGLRVDKYHDLMREIEELGAYLENI